MEFRKENLDLLSKNEANEKIGYSQGYVTFNGVKKRMDAMIEYIEDNNLEEKLEQEVWEIWQELHRPPERKVRQWR